MNKNFTSAFRCWVGKAALLSVLACPAALVSCGDDYDDTDLRNQIEDLDTRLKALETKVNNDIQAVSSLIAALEGKVDGLITVDKVVEADGVYTIQLSDGSSLSINKNNPSISPVTVLDVDGVKCWGVVNNGKAEALLDGEGNAIPVSVTVPPTVRVNGDTKEYEISADGGKTWQPTGMKAEGTQPSIFTKVSEDADSVTFTLADGTTLVVAKTSDFKCMSLAGKQYFAAGESKTIDMEMNKVSKYIITKPDGWKASIESNKLKITAPQATNNNAEKKGKVSVMAVSENGKSQISEVNVVIGTAPFTIEWNGGDEIVVKMSEESLNNWDYVGYLVGACNLKDFNPEKIIGSLGEDFELGAENKFSLKTLLGSDPVASESYVVWGIDGIDLYSGSGETYDVSNLVYKTVIGKTVSVEWGEITFEQANVDLNVKGIESYYATLVVKSWTNETEKSQAIADFVEFELNQGLPFGLKLNTVSSFSGEVSQIAGLSPKTGESYMLVIIPQDPAKEEEGRWNIIGHYTADDLYMYEFDMPGFTTGGSTSTGVAVTTAAITDISAKFTPSADSYKTYYNYYTEVDIQKFDSDDAIIKALMTGYLIKSGTAEFDWKKTGLAPGSKGYFVAISIDKNGKIGKLAKVEASTKELSFLEATVSGECTKVGPTSATIKFTASDNAIVKYRYFFQTKTAFGNSYPCNGDEAKAESELVMNSYWGNKETEEASIELTDLMMDNEYWLFVIGLDADGNSTKAVKVSFTPTLKVDWVAVDDANWAALKPNVTVKTERVGDYEPPCYSIAVDVTPADNCKEYYVWYGETELLPGFSIQRRNYIVANAKEGAQSGAVTDFVLSGYDYAQGTVIGIVSVDKDGKYYEPLYLDPHTGEEVEVD